MASNKYNKEILIESLKDYYEKFGVPTTRELDKNKDYPNSYAYRKYFGSFENALTECNIPIDNLKKKLCNRKKYTKEALLSSFKYCVDKSIEERGCLISDTDIDNIDELPSAKCYYKMFKTLDNVYKEIGISRNEFNNNKIEEDMKIKYIEIREIIKRTPHSRDLNSFSNNNDRYYTTTTYINHFGSIYNLQVLMGDIPTNWGSNLSDEELINRLIKLKDELGIVPTQIEVNMCEYTPHSSTYCRRFGSFTDAIRKTKMIPRSDKEPLITPKGNKALSGYEYKFMLVLEKYNIDYLKEEYYSKYIERFDKKYRFDFTLSIGNTLYFVEIFGISGNDNYDKKVANKIQICKDNNLNLIDLYGQDIGNNNFEEIYNLLLNEIKILKQ